MKESMGPMVAESKVSKKPPKVLDHLRVSRSLEGGHVIEHHYTSYQHEPKPYKFGKNEGGRAAAHILKHAGLSTPEGGEQGDRIDAGDEE